MPPGRRAARDPRREQGQRRRLRRTRRDRARQVPSWRLEARRRTDPIRQRRRRRPDATGSREPDRCSADRPRLVAVIDSDRKGPGDSESKNARRLCKTCDRHGLPCWVLAKREAKNYLPRVLLRERPSAGAVHARMVEAWERLSDAQKDFFDMKRGLPEDPPPIQEDLFDALPEADREILAAGFGRNVHECWNVWRVRISVKWNTHSGDVEHGFRRSGTLVGAQRR